MKRVYPENMVLDAAMEIEKLAPKHSEVAINVVEDPVGHYCTQIKLKTKSKTYFVKKEDIFLYKSFSKAIRAIKMQLQKNRHNHLHHHTSLKYI